MRINFSLLDESIEIKMPTTLVIEDTVAFSKIITDFYQYEDRQNIALFYDNYQPLKDTELLLITDVLSYNLNTSIILKQVYEDLNQQIRDNPEKIIKIEQAFGVISHIISTEIITHELNLVSSEFLIKNLFKIFDVKIVAEDSSIFEKMLTIIQIYKYLTKKKLLVFINTSVYLTTKELKELHAYISLNQVPVLFLEPREVSEIPQYILDLDYYIQQINMI